MPKSSLVARSDCIIQATQNKSKRAFSGAGHVVRYLLVSSIDPEHVDERWLLLVTSVCLRLTINRGHDCVAERDTEENDDD